MTWTAPASKSKLERERGERKNILCVEINNSNTVFGSYEFRECLVMDLSSQSVKDITIRNTSKLGFGYKTARGVEE